MKYSEEKLPAFFRVMSPELFFEAETMDSDKVLEGLMSNLELDEELEQILMDKSFSQKVAVENEINF